MSNAARLVLPAVTAVLCVFAMAGSQVGGHRRIRCAQRCGDRGGRRGSAWTRT